MLQHAHIILQVLEDRNRALDEEVSELRELRDQDGVSGNVRELELELKVSTSVHAIHSTCSRQHPQQQICSVTTAYTATSAVHSTVHAPFRLAGTAS